MFLGAHLALGLIIGKITGNYLIALAGSLAIDLDHLIPYIKHKIIYSSDKFWKTITDPRDKYGDQRNYLHSFIAWIAISFIISVFSNHVGFVFSIAYLGHLIVDSLDGSNFFPFYPLSKINFKGPIKYFSESEFLFTLVLFIIFFLS